MEDPRKLEEMTKEFAELSPEELAKRLAGALQLSQALEEAAAQERRLREETEAQWVQAQDALRKLKEKDPGKRVDEIENEEGEEDNDDEEGGAVGLTPAKGSSRGEVGRRNLGLHTLINPWAALENQCSVLKFKKRFLEVSEMGRWGVDDQRGILRLKCQGRAEAFLDANESLLAQNDPAPFWAAMVNRFTDPYELHNLQKELGNAKMEQGETSRDFAERVQQLGERLKAYGKDAEDVNQRVLMAFVGGLRPYVEAVVMGQEPATIEAALKLAAPFDKHPPRGWQTAATSAKESRATSEGIMVAQAVNRPRDEERGSQGGGKGAGGPICWRCNQRGHMSRSCPQPFVVTPDTQCHVCRGYGHISRTCPQGGQREQPPRLALTAPEPREAPNFPGTQGTPTGNRQ